MSEKQEQQAPALASAMPAEATVTPIDAAIAKPEEVHERVVSITSSDSDGEKQPDDDAKTQAPSLARTTSEIEYPPLRTTIIVMIAIMIAAFLVALDRTIIATAIPRITDEFDSLDDIGWYGSAFLLTASCFQLIFGRIYTFYSPKYIFLGLIGLFEVGSAICGAAPNSVAFIIGRAIAGIGSAGIMSGAIVLMLSVLPLAKRPLWQGFFGAVFGIASIIGPLLGGAFTTNVSWRWCFYINLPIGGVAMLIIFFLLPRTPALQQGLTLRQKIAKLDLLGELFLFPSIICLLLALQWGGTTYAWSNGRIIALFVLFAVLLIAFVLVQIFMQKTATIPAAVIKNRSILAGVWFIFCLASTMMALIYFIPTWFQAIKGTSAVRSGIDTLPQVLALVLGTISSGQIVGRLGYYTPLAMASAIIMPLGAGLISTWKLDTSTGMWIGTQILLGFGTGIGMQQANLAAQTVLKRQDVPTGIALMFFAQQIGGAIFISVGQNVFDTKLVTGLVKLVPSLSPEVIVNTGATDLRKIVPTQDLHLVLEVYNSALRQVFIVGTAMACLAAIGAFALEWRSVKGKEGSGGKVPPKAKTDSAGSPKENV